MRFRKILRSPTSTNRVSGHTVTMQHSFDRFLDLGVVERTLRQVRAAIYRPLIVPRFLGMNVYLVGQTVRNLCAKIQSTQAR